MTTDSMQFITDNRLAQARRLVEKMEAGDDVSAGEILEELSRCRESYLFDQLGRMTRDLHEALNNFHLDTRIATLTESDIPDAKERLNYVITMTEQAAHRTLNAVEEALPVSESLKGRAEDLHGKWRRFRSKDMNLDEFRELSREVDEFFAVAVDNVGVIHGNLSDVLMAQDYQDLTGQIIRKVIALVKEVEENLVAIIRVSGHRMKPEAVNDNKEDSGKKSNGHGPNVPGVDNAAEVVTGQDDVDDLLSSLGF